MTAPERRAGALVEALHGVLRQVAEPNAVLRAVLEQAVALSDARRGLFVEVEEEGAIAWRVLHGIEPKSLEGERGQFSRQIFQRVLDSKREVLIENALEDPILRGAESIRALNLRAILCVPIRAEGRIAALIHLESGSAGHFTTEHRDLVLSLVEVAGPVLETLRAGREVLRERDRLRVAEHRWRGEAEESRRQLASAWSFGRFVGGSPPVRELEQAVRKAAATEFPVLISGETGTGKTIVARALHYAGARAGGPLVTVFCPSLERAMVEAELFGHRRGAFTGAVSDRLGKVQAAEKGTLFLDEIGDLPLEVQPKLLRLLQEKTYERIGDPEERRADVRIIAATHRDLELEIDEGRFRRDLFERLCFLPLRVPPLRERIEDVPLLLRHTLDQTDSGRWIELTDEARAFLTALDFAWPGNVRHVEQLAARLTAEAPDGPVSAATVARLLGSRAARADGRGSSLDAGLPKLLEDAERKWLEEALRRYGSLTRAELAGKLKISESALYKKLRQYGLGT